MRPMRLSMISLLVILCVLTGWGSCGGPDLPVSSKILPVVSIRPGSGTYPAGKHQVFSIPEGHAAGRLLKLPTLDSYRVERKPLEWVNMSAASIRLASEVDDATYTAVPPFPIKLGNTTNGFIYASISTNGFITMDKKTDSPYVNQPLPETSHETLIAPFWDDLVFHGDLAGIYTETIGVAPGRKWVITYRGTVFGIPSTGTPLEFQVVFFENSSDIQFNYRNVMYGSPRVDRGISATIGVQVNPHEAEQIGYNTASVSTNLTLLWKTLKFVDPRVGVCVDEHGHVLTNMHRTRIDDRLLPGHEGRCGDVVVPQDASLELPVNEPAFPLAFMCAHAGWNNAEAYTTSRLCATLRNGDGINCVARFAGVCNLPKRPLCERDDTKDGYGSFGNCQNADRDELPRHGITSYLNSSCDVIGSADPTRCERDGGSGLNATISETISSMLSPLLVDAGTLDAGTRRCVLTGTVTSGGINVTSNWNLRWYYDRGSSLDQIDEGNSISVECGAPVVLDVLSGKGAVMATTKWP